MYLLRVPLIRRTKSYFILNLMTLRLRGNDTWNTPNPGFIEILNLMAVGKKEMVNRLVRNEDGADVQKTLHLCME